MYTCVYTACANTFSMYERVIRKKRFFSRKSEKITNKYICVRLAYTCPYECVSHAKHLFYSYACEVFSFAIAVFPRSTCPIT